MPIAYTISTTVTTTSTSGYTRLLHGSLLCHVTSLAKGVDFTKCNNEFWTTPDAENAWYYADLAEQNLMFTTGERTRQVIWAFSLPNEVIELLQQPTPDPLMYTYAHGIKFLPGCSETLNQAMCNVEVTFD